MHSVNELAQVLHSFTAVVKLETSLKDVLDLVTHDAIKSALYCSLHGVMDLRKQPYRL